MRFDLSLQNLKKSSVDIFSPQIERKKRRVFISAVERKKNSAGFFFYAFQVFVFQA